MDLDRPFSLVTPTLDGDVLSVLAQIRDELTSGQIHRAIGGRSAAGVSKVLERLTHEGLVERRVAGRTYLYALNRDHLAAPHIEGLAHLAATLQVRLSSEVSEWPDPPVVGIVGHLGATARAGTGRAAAVAAATASATMAAHPGGDLAILVVRPDSVSAQDWDQPVALLAHRAWRWTGTETQVIQATEAEVVERAPRDPGLARLATEGRVFAGSDGRFRMAVRVAILST